jgi:hypothetical protein
MEDEISDSGTATSLAETSISIEIWFRILHSPSRADPAKENKINISSPVAQFELRFVNRFWLKG